MLTCYSKVVQYILDLNDNRFSDAVIRQFTGNVCALSVQKFSSNVIEKVCLLISPVQSVRSHQSALFRVLYIVHPGRRALHAQNADRRASEPHAAREAP